ncbi:MAG TPA: 50S ribosomal protein L24 [Syntrophus sp. (in: bacteria)]|nr:50S ribosomal protein L24 [Syntrophus sp. (in: bacteria)]
MTKLSIRTGDKVQVIAGKDKGKEAKVLATVPYKQRVIVERVNMVKKATRPTQRNPKGGILEIEAPIHVSNVMLVCPSCSQPTRVGRKREDGNRVRVCKKCGNDIDK